jgi:putative flippase GtrA
MCIDFGCTWFLKERLHFNKYIANASGFILAACSNYILNRIWTFNSNDPHIAAEFLSFISIALIGLALNHLVVFTLSDKLQFNFYVAKFLAIIMVTGWNFLMNYLFTFS